MKTIIALFLSIQLPLLLTAQVGDLKALKIIEQIDKNMFSRHKLLLPK